MIVYIIKILFVIQFLQQGILNTHSRSKVFAVISYFIAVENKQMLGVYTHFFQFRAAVVCAIQTVRSFSTSC